jgi:hypothetical protein
MKKRSKSNDGHIMQTKEYWQAELEDADEGYTPSKVRARAASPVRRPTDKVWEEIKVKYEKP